MKLSSYFPWEISNSLLKWVEGKLMQGDGGRRGDKYGVRGNTHGQLSGNRWHT
jgi:hypothetical protein